MLLLLIILWLLLFIDVLLMLLSLLLIAQLPLLHCVTAAGLVLAMPYKAKCFASVQSLHLDWLAT